MLNILVKIRFILMYGHVVMIDQDSHQLLFMNIIEIIFSFIVCASEVSIKGWIFIHDMGIFLRRLQMK